MLNDDLFKKKVVSFPRPKKNSLVNYSLKNNRNLQSPKKKMERKIVKK